MQEKEFSERFNRIQNLKHCVCVICSFEIVDANDPRYVLFAVDVVLGFELIQFLEIFLAIARLKIKFDISNCVGFYFVVIRQAVHFVGIQVDEDVMVQFNTMQIGWSGHAFSLEVSPADEAGIDTVVRQGNRANLLQIEVQEVSFDSAEVGTFDGGQLLLGTGFHTLLQILQTFIVITHLIVMFLEEFEESSHPHHKHKQTRKEYSAGFRNYHPKKAPSDGIDTIENSEDDDLFAQLKIGNLKELYMHSQPVIDNSKKIVEEQMKSVMRLMMPVKNESKVQEKKEEEISQEQKLSMVHKFNETYHKEESFKQKAVVTLFRNQFKRIHYKLLEKTKGDFTQVFTNYFSTKYDELQKMNRISNQDLLISYTNFTNDRKGKDDKIKQFKAQKEEIQHLLQRNMFLYGFYLLSKVKSEELNYSGLKQAIRTEEEFNKMFEDKLIYSLIDKKFTVPYDSDVARAKMTPKTVQLKQQPSKVKLHANPIPKTTYEKPKQRPKSHMSKTKTEPFNLTQNTTKPIDMNQFYKWDRTFHAQEVPPTTYKPNMAITMTEAEMKKRAQDLLKTSDFPATMTYLNDYSKYAQNQHEKLMKKYTKNHQISPYKKQIPDFTKSHKNQLMQLEVRKEQNKHITEPKPFNLSHPRPPKPAEPQHVSIDPKQYEEAVDQQNKVRKIKIQPQSTLKYEAYVNHIKTTKQQKEKKKESLAKEEKKQQKTRNEYQNILKSRIDDELNRNPKKLNNPQALSTNQVKVNLQKIYQQEPLLIERQAAKSKKHNIQPTLSWTPII